MTENGITNNKRNGINFAKKYMIENPGSGSFSKFVHAINRSDSIFEKGKLFLCQFFLFSVIGNS